MVDNGCFHKLLMSLIRVDINGIFYSSNCRLMKVNYYSKQKVNTNSKKPYEIIYL